MKAAKLFEVLLVALTLAACGGVDDPTFDEMSADPSVGDIRQEILNGVPINPENTGIVLVQAPAAGSGWNCGGQYCDCSGTLVENWAIVTAAHCVDHVSNPSTVTLTMGSQQTVASHVRIHPSWSPGVGGGDDVAVVLLRTPFQMSGKRYGHKYPIYGGSSQDYDGMQLFCYGYGMSSFDDPADSTPSDLHAAILEADALTGTVDVLKNSQGQVPFHGDSGGPCFLWGGSSLSLVSVMSSIDSEENPTTCHTEPSEAWRDWAADVIRGVTLPFQSDEFDSFTLFFYEQYNAPTGISGPPSWMIDWSNGVMTEPSNFYDPDSSSAPHPAWPAQGSIMVHSLMQLGDGVAWVKVKGTPNVDNDGTGLIFRFVDNDNYYRYSFDDQRNFLRLAKKQDGVFTRLWQVAASTTYSSNPELKVWTAGDTIALYFNGSLVGVVYDGTFRFGRVGLYQWGQGGSRDPATFESLSSVGW